MRALAWSRTVVSADDDEITEKSHDEKCELNLPLRPRRNTVGVTGVTGPLKRASTSPPLQPWDGRGRKEEKRLK
jgi:hypothetical protein